jgi:hypothetical protein
MACTTMLLRCRKCQLISGTYTSTLVHKHVSIKTFICSFTHTCRHMHARADAHIHRHETMHARRARGRWWARRCHWCGPTTTTRTRRRSGRSRKQRSSRPSRAPATCFLPPSRSCLAQGTHVHTFACHFPLPFPACMAHECGYFSVP